MLPDAQSAGQLGDPRAEPSSAGAQRRSRGARDGTGDLKGAEPSFTELSAAAEPRCARRHGNQGGEAALGMTQLKGAEPSSAGAQRRSRGARDGRGI